MGAHSRTESVGARPPANLGTFWAVGLRCEVIRGLREIIKSEVAGERTLGFISASHQAGHGERVAELSRTPARQRPPRGTQQTPAPQSPSACVGELAAVSPPAAEGTEHLWHPKHSDMCFATARPRRPLGPGPCSPGSSPGIPRDDGWAQALGPGVLSAAGWHRRTSGCTTMPHAGAGDAPAEPNWSGVGGLDPIGARAA